MQTSASVSAAGAELIGAPVELLDKPALVVDADLLQSNIRAMIERIGKHKGVSVRPHLKTGKCLPVAEMLLAAGAGGICVAKLSEAEVFAAAGIGDILVTS